MRFDSQDLFDPGLAGCVRWELWSAMKMISVREALLLSLKLDPDYFPAAPATFESWHIFAFAEALSMYDDRLRIVSSYSKDPSHNLFSTNRVADSSIESQLVVSSDFSSWSKGMGWGQLLENGSTGEAELASADISERRLSSLHKLVIGLAIKGYRYNPEAKVNNAVSEIEADLASLHLSLSDETIRKILKTAYNDVCFSSQQRAIAPLFART